MLRLSKLADYAVVVLVRLADGDRVQTSPGIALITGLPEPTVAKVLKALATNGLVASQRGARGGYRLTRPLASMHVADVVAAIDGPVHITACVEGSPTSCDAEHVCSCRGGWDKVNEAVMQALGTISLADIAPAGVQPRTRTQPALPAE